MGIFIDIRKAFDTVDHSMQLISCSVQALEVMLGGIFKSYLDNRVQSVKINNDVFSSLK